MAKKKDKLIDAESQEPLIGPIDRNRFKKYGEFSYQESYCDIVFELLSSNDGAKTKAHCCKALLCSKTTLLRWMKKYPEFNKAVISGMDIGKAKWREKIREHAFKPSSEVNNGLIKLLSSNVYGIKEDPEPAVVINNTNTMSPEEALKKRGIPVPKVNSEDLDNV